MGIGLKDITHEGPGATSGIFVLPVSSSSAAFDLANDLPELKAAIAAGKTLALSGDVACFYRWDTETGTVDETKTFSDTPENQGQLLPLSRLRHERAPRGSTWLIVQGGATGALRIHVAG